MVFCRGCGHQIHETAPACPKCGAPQAVPQPGPPPKSVSLWMAWVSLSVAGIPLLVFLTEDRMDHDEVVGAVLFVFVAISFATTSLIQGRGGKGLSIAAIVVGVVAVLGAIGSQ